MSENGSQPEADAAANTEVEVPEAAEATIPRESESEGKSEGETKPVKTGSVKTGSVKTKPTEMAETDGSATLKQSESEDETKPAKPGSAKSKPNKAAKNDDNATLVTPKTPTKRGTKKTANVGDDERKEGKVTPKSKAKTTPTKAKSDAVKPGDDEDEAATPTSSKKKRNSAAVNDDDDADSPSTPRKRRAPNKPQTPGRTISTKLEDASEEDKMLISMKDNGKPWAEIRKAWKEMTGEDTGTSTLPNRYNRLKANLASFKEEDEPKLLAAKAEVEKANELEFWGKVGAAMEVAGADKYPIKALEKRFKEIQKRPTEVQVPVKTDEDDEADEEE